MAVPVSNHYDAANSSYSLLPRLEAFSCTLNEVSIKRLAHRIGYYWRHDRAFPPGCFTEVSHHEHTHDPGIASSTRRVTIEHAINEHEDSDNEGTPSLADESSDDGENYTVNRRSYLDPFSDDEDDAQAIEYESGSGCSESEFMHDVTSNAGTSSKNLQHDDVNIDGKFTVFELYAHDEPNSIGIADVANSLGLTYEALEEEGFDSLDHHLYTQSENKVGAACSTRELCCCMCPRWSRPSSALDGEIHQGLSDMAGSVWTRTMQTE